MVNVSHPGVYIQEVASGVHTITGVSTSIGAFLGRTSKGPIDTAIRLLSKADYTRAFGAPHADSDLGHSVMQFFDNGGTDCYVVRLAAAGTTARSGLALRNVGGASPVVRVEAKTVGQWGDGLRLEVDYNTPTPDDTFNLRVIYIAGGAVAGEESFANLSMDPQSSSYAPDVVSRGSTLVDMTADAGAAALIAGIAGFSQTRPIEAVPDIQTAVSTLLTTASTHANLDISVDGREYITVDLGGPLPADVALAADANAIALLIQARINGFLNPQLGSDAVLVTAEAVGAATAFRIEAAFGDNRSVRIKRASADDIAATLMLGVDQGGFEPTRHSILRPAFTGSGYAGDNPATFDDYADAPGLASLAALPNNAFDDLLIEGVTVNLPGLVTGAPGDPWYQDSGGGFDGVREKLRYIVDQVNGDPTVGWRAELWGYRLAFVKTAVGTSGDSMTSLATTSGDATLTDGVIPNVSQYALGTSSAGTFFEAALPGSDGSPPAPSDYIGSQAAQTGMRALDPVDLFNLMVIPGDRALNEADFQQIWGPASNYCQQRRAFLIVDPPDSWTSGGRPVAQAADVNGLRALLTNENAAVYYPRVEYQPGKFIGPAGMIAGLMARTDSTRGVWKAPAGLDADLRSILGVEIKLTDAENGVLNKLGVNCIRQFPTGFVNWGARTLDGSDDIGSEWKYVPIRRLALFLEESLFRGTHWVVFEPNDEPLWAKIRLNLKAFMMSLFRQGAFEGGTPDKAFYVKCDGETTTANDRNLGIVNIEVGFAPLKPAEFVIIKIQQIAGLT